MENFTFIKKVMLFIMALLTISKVSAQENWELLVNNPLSVESPKEEITTGPIIASDAYTVKANLSEDQTKPYSIGNYPSNSFNYVAYIYEIKETGTYKFSYRIKKDGDSSNYTAKLFWSKNNVNNSKNDASAENTVTNEAMVLETEEINITEPGTYIFGIKINFSEISDGLYYVADFKLYMKSNIKRYKITWEEPDNGKINVLYNNSEIINGETVPEESEIKIETFPNDNYELVSLTAGDEDITENKLFQVKHDTEINAVFEIKKYSINWTQPEIGGKIKVMAGEIELTPGEKVEKDTKISVDVFPEEGYELETLTVNGSDISRYKIFYASRNIELVVKFKATTSISNISKPGFIYKTNEQTIYSGKPIAIFDITGKLICKSTSNATNISNLKSGIYLIKCEAKTIKIQK